MPTKAVLIVEDDQDIRESLAEILQEEGYEVLLAENGQVALDLLLEARTRDVPCCILLDLMMPIMGGVEFLLTIQSRHREELAKIPVIIATAKGSANPTRAELPAHAGFVRKPIDLDALFEAIKSCCWDNGHP